MTQTLDSLVKEVESGEQRLTYEAISGRDVQETERVVDSFASVLRRMTREERISASRHGGFTRWERWVYNHAEWYVAEVLAHAHRFVGDGTVEAASGSGCAAAASAPNRPSRG